MDYVRDKLRTKNPRETIIAVETPMRDDRLLGKVIVHTRASCGCSPQTRLAG